MAPKTSEKELYRALWLPALLGVVLIGVVLTAIWKNERSTMALPNARIAQISDACVRMQITYWLRDESLGPITFGRLAKFENSCARQKNNERITAQKREQQIAQRRVFEHK